MLKSALRSLHEVLMVLRSDMHQRLDKIDTRIDSLAEKIVEAVKKGSNT